MEINLYRFDVLQTGATAQGSLKVSPAKLGDQDRRSRGRARISACVQVLPQGQNRQQKLAVGDSAGVIQCVSVKKGEIVAAFKTLPTGQRVSHVTLGRGQAIQRDKIFVAQGQTVRTCHARAKQEVPGRQRPLTKQVIVFRCKASQRRANSSTTLTPTWRREYPLYTSVTTAYGSLVNIPSHSWLTTLRRNST